MQTCLVIDEFSVVRKIMSRILTMSGYVVHSAETPEDAQPVMSSAGPIDIVIISATLPCCAVEEAIRQICAHPSARDAVILASLVEANLGVMTRAKRAGATGFIYRPFDRATLTEWLQAYDPGKKAAASA